MTVTELKEQWFNVYRAIRQGETQLVKLNRLIEEAENGQSEISETAGNIGRPKSNIEGDGKTPKTTNKAATG